MAESSIPDVSSVASPPRRDLNYRLVKEGQLIGSGGQAIVKRVELPGEEAPQRVAVKEPQQPAKTVDMEEVESFFEEARTWRALDSREREKPLWVDSEHIVGVVDIGADLPWLAMEYMDGGSLADRLDENPNGLPLDEALWIGECLCKGVKLAHDYGIAHLDLKPANVLFRKTGGGTWDVPKIADWGLSRVLIEHSGSMDALSVEYAAPEQFDSSRFGDPDKYTDIYQLGALVYALLTGNPPYTGNQATIMHDIVYGDLPLNPSDKTNATTDLDNVITMALNKQKGERYSDVGRFAEELRNIRRMEMEVYDDADPELNTNTTPPKRCSPKEALEETKLFIRYASSGRATLEKAHAGNIEASAVNNNLKIQHHTQFEADDVTVNGEPYETFLAETIHYQFVEWVVRTLPYEIRDTSHEEELRGLYDALPKIDHAALNGVVAVRYKEGGEQRRGQKPFDVILRDPMGNPLLVANLNDSRAAATEMMMEDLITAAERVGQTSKHFAGAFMVTQSFFDPGALETARDETQGGLLSSGKRKSFVNLSRKQGYHLCLVEARNENFHLAVPEL